MINDILTMLLICTCSSVFSIVYVHVLTAPHGIFSKLPKVQCEVCFSGWLSMFFVAAICSIYLEFELTLIAFSQALKLVVFTASAGAIGIFITPILFRWYENR
jgi:hypothetical protein